MDDAYTIPVNETSLLQRVNKILAKDDHRLVKSRSNGEKSNMGEWYVIETHNSQVVDFYCKIEEIGRTTGALKSYEHFLKNP